MFLCPVGTERSYPGNLLRAVFVIVLVVVLVLESAFLPGIFKRLNPPRFSDVRNAGKNCLFEDEDDDEDEIGAQ
jgi:hypothetical protein